MPDSPANAIINAVKDAVARDSWSRNGRLYVSDLKHALPPDDSGDCPRKLRAKLDDEEMDPLNDGTKLMFRLGDELHELIVDWIVKWCSQNAGWEVAEIETPASPEDDVGGRADLVIKTPSGRNDCVVDIKTTRGGSFNYLDSVKARDELQVQAYMKALDLESGYVVYVDREGSNFIKIFQIKRDDESVDEAINELRFIRDAPVSDIPVMEPRLKVNKNKGPDSIEINMPWQISYCPLKECHCRKMLDGDPPKGVIGHIKKSGVKLKPQYRDNDELREWIEKRLANEQ